MPSAASNGLPSASYQTYEAPPPPAPATNGPRIKAEPGTESQTNGFPNGYQHSTGQQQGGLARAQQLVQQQYGPNAQASLTAMQRAGGGLALPGQQQQQQTRPQGLHLPGQPMSANQQFSPQQQQAMMRQQQQQQQLQQQQHQPRIKVENDSPQLPQGNFQQQSALPNYSQTDGADDAYEQW